MFQSFRSLTDAPKFCRLVRLPSPECVVEAIAPSTPQQILMR
ncbi:hypothetical protein BRCON_1693 [Candidatus Sumerlaea chitinivorans]|uniref:Uncharacterized protein n=1 Tax=Sumerlaea chitinivorans TaxID=2250252 RepID=A0A2Z4Y5N1_SUMC1|nr:hypothetical protein BRCON_1693 [Candidatus Sumerlaea chitinivorans]